MSFILTRKNISLTGVPASGTMPLEAALLQDMRHDCIVNLLQKKFVTTPQEEQQLWLVMEFCDKGPLDVRHSSARNFLYICQSAEHLWLTRFCFHALPSTADICLPGCPGVGMIRASLRILILC